MKKSLCSIGIILSLFCSDLQAQRISVSLHQVVSNAHVTYKTANASIDFDNRDIVSQFAILSRERWFEFLPGERRQRFGEAITRLDAGNSVTLGENEPSGESESAIAELIKEVLGADLLRAGKAQVLNKKKKIQSTIQYEPSASTSDEAIYDFYFEGGRSPFFSARAMKELSRVEAVQVETSQSEVIYEEPVEEVVDDENRIYTLVEEQPTYPGGMDKLKEYMTKNLKYPKEAKKNGIEGKVFVQFVVEKDGVISNVSVVKGLEESCDQEAMRLIRDSGVWIPGKQNHKVQRVKLIYPVKFELSEKP